MFGKLSRWFECFRNVLVIEAPEWWELPREEFVQSYRGSSSGAKLTVVSSGRR